MMSEVLSSKRILPLRKFSCLGTNNMHHKNHFDEYVPNLHISVCATVFITLPFLQPDLSTCKMSLAGLNKSSPFYFPFHFSQRPSKPPLHPLLLCSRQLPAVAESDISSIWLNCPLHLSHCLKCSSIRSIHHDFSWIFGPFQPFHELPAAHLPLRLTCPSMNLQSVTGLSTNLVRSGMLYRQTVDGSQNVSGVQFPARGSKIENLSCAHAMGTLRKGNPPSLSSPFGLITNFASVYFIQSFLLPHGSLNQIGWIDSEEANCFCLLLPWDEIS